MNLNYLRSSALNHSVSPPPLLLIAVTSSSYQCQVTCQEGNIEKYGLNLTTLVIANARNPRGTQVFAMYYIVSAICSLVTVILKLYGDKKSNSFHTHIEIFFCFYIVLNLDMFSPVLTVFRFPSTSREPAAHPELRQVSNQVFK